MSASSVKKMMKDDPDFAKQVKKMRDAQNDLQKSLDNFIKLIIQY